MMRPWIALLAIQFTLGAGLGLGVGLAWGARLWRKKPTDPDPPREGGRDYV